MKKCNKCKEIKELFLFHKHSRFKDGYRSICKVCTNTAIIEKRKANPNLRKDEWIKKRERLGKKTRQEWKENLAATSIGRKTSSLKYATKRRRTLEKALQNEFDEFVFEEAVNLAGLRKQETGFTWHVDHIVPLFHKKACGLNTAANFQVVPAAWNLKKGNRNMNEFWPLLVGRY